jgi:hypothetical protein
MKGGSRSIETDFELIIVEMKKNGDERVRCGRRSWGNGGENGFMGNGLQRPLSRKLGIFSTDLDGKSGGNGQILLSWK